MLDKDLLKLYIPEVIMPKKEKDGQVEQVELCTGSTGCKFIQNLSS